MIEQPKYVVVFGNGTEVGILDLPENVIDAVNIVLGLVDEHVGNFLQYPRLLLRAELESEEQ